MLRLAAAPFAALALTLAAPLWAQIPVDPAPTAPVEASPTASAPEPASEPPSEPLGKPADPPTPVASPPPSEGRPPTAPPEPAFDADTFRGPLVAHLGPLALSPIVLVAAEAIPYVGDDAFYQAGDVSEQPGFRLRRARFGMRGVLAEQAAFALSGEIGVDDNSALGVHDAWLGWVKHKELSLYAGAREVPFSRSALVSAAHTSLTDRPFVVRAMAPANQVGMTAEGNIADGKLLYRAGAFNGFQRDVLFYGGFVENYAPVGNRFDGLAYAARVGTEPLGPLGDTIEDIDGSPFCAGFAGDVFFSDGGTRDLLSAGGDVLLHASGFHFLAEVMWSRSEPESVPTQTTTQVTTISSLGLVAEAGYMVLPKRLGVTARVEWLDANQDVEDETDNLIVTGGLSYRVVGEVLKLQADFTHREEQAGLSLSNDAFTLKGQLAL